MKPLIFIFSLFSLITGFGFALSSRFVEQTKLRYQKLSSKLPLEDKAPKNEEIKNPREGTFGYDFKYHFVDAEDTSNDDWWRWNYKNRYLGSVEDRYGSVENFPYSSQAIRSYSDLKDVCKNAYSQEMKAEKLIGERFGTFFQEQYVWIYCSANGVIPITLEDDLEWEILELEDDCYSSEEGSCSATMSFVQESALVSSDSVNDLFWENQTKAFFGSEDGKWEGLGKKAKLEDAGFKKLYDDNKQKTTDKEILKNQCSDNYKKKDEEDWKKILSEVTMFCSLRGSLGMEQK
ncbi:hypothetical protein MHSWG343_10750 [Candidatus Mycoplasma haematohominis]|uniref:Uncharacterized protein n=1 Tax=Candidatus Mycoplasma haematohominis TaxID=1494318 RepID=A0A478FS76_9MOLU|nr:hypothetical protein MHSWG343_10750 [Candidatus Mycoplasma haemohominis]